MRILKGIVHAIVEAGDIVDAFMSSEYGASRSKIEYKIRKTRRQREFDRARWEEFERIQKRCRNALTWLKRERFIVEHVESGKKRLRLTKKGFRYLRSLTKREKSILPKKYPMTSARSAVIVMFDIHEREKWKRNWLRNVLKNGGFKMRQKSVWIGNVKFPASFIEDLIRIGIIEDVEIFEAVKLGTLHEDA